MAEGRKEAAGQMMFWKKPATPDYLLKHFERFLEVIEKHAAGSTGPRDALYQYIFVMTFFTATANNILKLKQQDVEAFVAASVRSVLNRTPGLGDDDLAYLTNACADCLRVADMYFADASKTFFDIVVANDQHHAIQKDDFVRMVSSACAGLIQLLQRDGYAR
jgi:hypothetical protein